MEQFSKTIKANDSLNAIAKRLLKRLNYYQLYSEQ